MSARRTRVLDPWGTAILADIAAAGITRTALLAAMSLDTSTFYRWLSNPPGIVQQRQVERTIAELGQVATQVAAEPTTTTTTTTTAAASLAGASAGFRAVLANAVTRGQSAISVHNALYWLDRVEEFHRQLDEWRFGIARNHMLDAKDAPLVACMDTAGICHYHGALSAYWARLLGVPADSPSPAGESLSDSIGALRSSRIMLDVHYIHNLGRHHYYRRTYVDRRIDPPEVFHILVYGAPFVNTDKVLLFIRSIDGLVAEGGLPAEAEEQWLDVVTTKSVREPAAIAPAGRSHSQSR